MSEKMNLSNLPRAEFRIRPEFHAIPLSILKKAKTEVPTDTVVEQLAELYRVNIDWLKTGVGQMDPEQPDFDPVRHMERFIPSKQRAQKTADVEEGSLAKKFSKTTIIIRHYDLNNNRGWTCLIPEISLEREISVSLSPLIDRHQLSELGFI